MEQAPLPLLQKLDRKKAISVISLLQNLETMYIAIPPPERQRPRLLSDVRGDPENRDLRIKNRPRERNRWFTKAESHVSY
jgi:hypothetical protein